MIALLHGYRASNRGDGWLVQLAQDAVHDALGEEAVTYAVDPTNMPGDTRSVLGGGNKVRALAAAGLTVIPGSLSRSINSRVVGIPRPAECSAAFGVGGAYLRANDAVHEVVVRSHHLPQLQLLSELGPRAGYLPISVGPFRKGLFQRVRRELSTLGFVAVRDDRSASELCGLPNVHRIPDLAALSLGSTRPQLGATNDGSVAIAVRALAGTDLGMDVGKQLATQGKMVRYGVQSSVGRTNDDTKLYDEAGVLSEAEDFGDLLASPDRPAVVIAGRLHAALAALSAGYPTIHLGYERKSWGAFADLGLDDWVLHAWKAEPAQVIELAEGLIADPSEYWSRLERSFDGLSRRREQLVELIAAAAPT